MANTRIFELAKELGIKSKAIVEKCHAEGIPKDVIKNHMSTISIGLEQTVREWFSSENTEESPHTAVEKTERVDLEKARSPKKATKAKQAGSEEYEDEGSSGKATAVAAPPPPPATKITASKAAASASPATKATAKATPTALSASTATPASEVKVPAAAPAATSSPAPAAKSVDASAGDAPAAVSGSDDQSTKDTVATKDTAAAAASAPEKTTVPAAKPQMNIPTRPSVITPAGPRIEDLQKKTIKLSGPKVIRVEAPERIDPPRRRPPPREGGGYQGGGGGGGYDPSMPPSEGRSPRGGSTRRRSPGGAGVRRPEGAPSSGWSAADLAERDARLKQSGGYLQRRQNQMRSMAAANQSPAKVGGKVTIGEPFTIKDLSAATGVKGADIIKKLFMQGVISNINSGIDSEKAMEIMIDWDIELEVVEAKGAEEQVAEQFAERTRTDERARGPIVTILGHVDHGKTSLLDRIRKANVADGEAGGITQATSAFRVPVKTGDSDKFVTFIDTPGHEAFTAMRSRGANVTDIVVLVVAADDGVMPQTIESISHSKAAGVPIIVALNKIDKEQATDGNIQKILGQLAEHGLNPTDWGGDTEVIRTSAIKDIGIQDLLDILDLQAEILELKADYSGQAQGTVIEAKPEGGRGNVANILVQEGELKVGDFIVMGRAFGRVRDITDDHGKRIKQALPPVPVQISGMNDLPDAGDKFYCVSSLKEAEKAADQRRDRERLEQLAQPKVTLDSMFSQMAANELKEILVVLKADVQGSVDVLKSEIEKVSGDEVKVRVIHSAVGGITESDILLAHASDAVIIGFNVIANSKGRTLAEAKRVEIRNYQVIYHIVEDMRKAAEGMLAPEIREEVLGHADVREVFKVSKVGAIAGCYVTDGIVQRDAMIRVTRNGVVVENNRKLEQLKRFKDDAKEVRNNMECGMKVAGYDDIKTGDVIECYKSVEIKRTLD